MFFKSTPNATTTHRPGYVRVEIEPHASTSRTGDHVDLDIPTIVAVLESLSIRDLQHLSEQLDESVSITLAERLTATWVH